ncbi:MAG: hypothetical protein K6G70_09210 [Bacteroidaceae bacterium]|nr:hypothetical protein [Bacteroidaceae bacterium]
MKKLLSILALALFACAFTFVACGEDDEPTPSTNNGTNNGGNSGDLARQIIGSWYLTEVSADKLLVNVIVFNANGQGTFSEIKAKAKNNWEVTEESAPFTYTLSGNRVTMVFTREGRSETRVGDIVMNGDGSASVTHDSDGGQSSVTQQMMRLNGKTGREIMNELLNNQNGGNSGDLATQILGSWYLTEVSADKLLVNVIVFNAGGQGTFSEIKAKAKNNWEVTEESAPFTYTLSGNRVTMVFSQGGQSETRVGDIVMNGDGSASVTHDADGGQSTVTQQMLRLNGKTGRGIMDELLNNQSGGDNNLIGTWAAEGEQVKNVFTFTNDKLTISEYFMKDGSWTLVRENGWEGSYTLENGVLTYNEESFTVKLLYDNTALAILGPGYVQHILYKQDATVPATLQDIQGDWRWYMDGDPENTRAAVQIEGNHMTMIIVAWGQRYDGTITYANGFIHFEVTAAYTSREEGTGEGWGEGELDPETLEANWKPLDPGSWMYFDTHGMPFVANGNEAYGILANLPGIYYKQ